MKVKLNRNLCDANLAYCERCLGKFLRNPMGYERRCFTEIEDDGKEELTLEITTGDHHTVLVLDEEKRNLLAGDGWAYYVDFAVPMYRLKEEEHHE